jgi:hypothetical protein
MRLSLAALTVYGVVIATAPASSADQWLADFNKTLNG